MMEDLLALLGRVALGTLILYILFWVVWLYYHDNCLQYALKSKDKKWAKSADPEPLLERGISMTETRTIFFLRHGQSTWNITFNQSKLPWNFIARLISSAIKEISLAAKGIRDSWFLDSPLSKLGIKQAEEARQFLKNNASDDLAKILAGKSGADGSVIVSSCLRRALSTAVVAFYDRLRTTEEKIVMLPCLQEVSTNPDTVSITPAHTVPEPSWIEKDHANYNIPKVYATQVDVSQYTGNKAIDSNGLKRMTEFCEWAFESNSMPNVIVAGHSLWMRFFFKEFMAHRSKHDAKKYKVHNGGIVAFTLEKHTLHGGQVVYHIPENQIRSVVRGFATNGE